MVLFLHRFVGIGLELICFFCFACSHGCFFEFVTRCMRWVPKNVVGAVVPVLTAVFVEFVPKMWLVQL